MYKSFILFVICIILLVVAVTKNNDLSKDSVRTETSGTMSDVNTMP